MLDMDLVVETDQDSLTRMVMAYATTLLMKTVTVSMITVVELV